MVIVKKVEFSSNILSLFNFHQLVCANKTTLLKGPAIFLAFLSFSVAVNINGNGFKGVVQAGLPNSPTSNSQLPIPQFLFPNFPLQFLNSLIHLPNSQLFPILP